MRLHVEWISDERCYQGGFYALCKGNGHLFASLAEKGRNETSRKNAQEICRRYNVVEESFGREFPR